MRQYCGAISLIALIVATSSLADGSGSQLPTGGIITSGQGSIVSGSNHLAITQHTNVMDTSWSSFDVGVNAKVSISQPSASSTLIGRISGGRPSSIDGTLTANGRVVLINPNGIHFGANSRVDVGGIVASSLNLIDYSENAATLSFEGGARATVRQAGVIKSDYVALVGKRVEQVGRIEATTGDAALLAGDRVEISIGGSGLISAKVDALDGAGSIETSGSIKAENGDILIKAEAASELLSEAIHGDQKQSLVFKDGRLVLVNATGKMTADNIAIDAGDAGAAVISGSLNASKTEDGIGGGIQVLGGAVHLDAAATLNASGADGGGIIQVGGSWQNSDSNVRQSTVTRVFEGAQLIADALHRGNGGEIVVWSDVRDPNSSTSVAGTLSASALGVSGSGGRIETSGFSLFTDGVAVEASAVGGAAGTWLLDPINISISDATDIESTLEGGTSVTLSTTDGTKSDAGFIKFTDAVNVNLTSDVSLTLQAHGEIELEDEIVASGTGALNVTLNSNFGDGVNSGVLVMETIRTNGGDITIGGGSAGDGSGYAVNDGYGVELRKSIRSYGGDITVRGKSTYTASSWAGVLVDGGQIYADGGRIAIYGQYSAPFGSGLEFRIGPDIADSGWVPDVGVPAGVDDRALRSVLYSASETGDAVYLYSGSSTNSSIAVGINFKYVGGMVTNTGGMANTPPIFASGGGNVVLKTEEFAGATGGRGGRIRLTNGVYVNGGEYHLITGDGFASHEHYGSTSKISSTTIGLDRLSGGYSYYVGTTGNPKTIIRTDASALSFSTRSAGDLSIYGYTNPDNLSTDYSVAFKVNDTAEVSADIVLYEPISNLRLTGGDVRLRRITADNVQVVAENIYINDYDTSIRSGNCATNSGSSLSACKSNFGSAESPVATAYLRATSSIEDSQTNTFDSQSSGFAANAKMYVGELILEGPYIDLRHGGLNPYNGSNPLNFDHHMIGTVAVRGTSTAIYLSNAQALTIGSLSAVSIDPISSVLTQTVSGISTSDRLVIETASGNLTVSAPISSSGTGLGTKDHYQDGSFPVPLTEFFDVSRWTSGGRIVAERESSSYRRYGDYFDYPVVLNAGFKDSGHTDGSLVFSTNHAITMTPGTRALLLTGGVGETVGIANYVGDGQSRFGARKSNLYQPNTSTASSIQGLAAFDSTYVGIYREQPAVAIGPTSATQTVVYGGSIDTASSISGLVGSDTEGTVLSGSVAYAISGATSTSGNYVVGDHSLSFTGDISNSVGYTVSYTVGAVSITAKPVTVSYSSSAKTYDGSVNATVAETITGLVSGDLVTTQETAVFDSPDVAYASGSVTAQTISISSAQLAGADSANYSLGTTSYSSSAQINPKTVTVSGARAYDGTATFSTSDLSVTTDITGQSLTLSGAATANAATVASASYLSDVSSLTLVDGTGGTAANYALSTGQDNLVSVAQRTVGLAFSRAYNGRLAASGADFTVTTGVSDESLTVSGAGTLDSSHVSLVSGLSSYGDLALAGGTAANYTLPALANVSVSILPYTITQTSNAVTKDYDGTDSKLSSHTLSFTNGGLSSDANMTVSVSYTGASFNSEDVASATTFTYTGGSIDSVSTTTTNTSVISDTPLVSDFALNSSTRSVAGTITAYILTADNLSFYVRDSGGTYATYANLDDTDAVFTGLFGSDSLLFDDSGLSASSDLSTSSGTPSIKASSLTDATLTNADSSANTNYQLNTSGGSGASIYTVDAARNQLKIVTLESTNPYKQVYDADTALDADFTNFPYNNNGYWGIYDVTNDQLLSSSAFVASNGIINGSGGGLTLDENVSFTATLASADASDTASVNLTGAYYSGAESIYKSAFNLMNEFVDSTGSIQVLRRPIVVESSGTLGAQGSPGSPAVITKYYDGSSDVGSLLGLQEAADQSYNMFINSPFNSTSITAGIIDGDDAIFNSSPTIAARADSSGYTATEIVNSTYNSSVYDGASRRLGNVIETAAWVSVSGDALLSGTSAGNYDIVYDDGLGTIISDQTINGTTYENAVRIRLKIAPQPVSLSATRAYDGSSDFTLSDISVATGVSGEALTLSQTTYTNAELQAARALVPFINEVPLATSDAGYDTQVSDLITAANAAGINATVELAQSQIASNKTTYDALMIPHAYSAITNDGDGTYTAVQDKTSSSVILSVTGPHELVASGSETLNNYCLSDCFTISGVVATGFTLSRGSTTTLTNSSLANVTVLDITAAADITAKSASITPTSGLQKLVGDSDPTFTYTAAGVLDGETLSGALSRTSGETAGEYAYTVGTLASLNTNYSFSLTPETFQISSSVPLTLSGFTLLNKLYDGSASGALSLVSSWGTLAGAFRGSDQSTVALDTSSATLTFGQADVGSDLSVTVANLGLTGTNSSAYSVANFTTTADITARPVSLTASSVSKTYGDADPTLAVTAATATGTTGLASTDSLTEVTGTLTRQTGENVGAYDVALGSGSKAGNYAINFETDNNALTIGQRSITLAATSVSKVYGDSDPTLAVTVTSGSLGSSTVYDVLTDVSGTLTRESGSNVGSYDVVLESGTAASNYDITFVSDNDAVSITARPLTATGSVSGKNYDGSTDATVSVTLSNLVGSETISSSVAAAFGSANVGSQTATVSSVSLSGGTGGGLANNYSLAVSDITLSGSGQATISPKSLTATASVSGKVYDKTVAADVSLSFDGLVGSEDLGQTVAASFNSALAGNRQATIDSFSISNGTAGLAANYSLSGDDIDFSSNTATIARKTLSVSGAGTASDKIYDGTTSVIADISGLTFSGLLAGDGLGTPAASFSDANAGSNKAVSVSFTGGDGANYVVPSVSGLTATITPKALAGVATVSDKAYDGNMSADVSIALSGLVPGEGLGITTAASFGSKNVGTRTATINSFSLSDTATGSAANYSLSNSNVNFTSNIAAITRKALAGVATVSGRPFEAGNTDANVLVALSGLVTGETLNTTVKATFDSAEAGLRAATISDVTLLDGTGLADNYTLTLNKISFANHTALITPGGVAYQLGKENRLAKSLGARPLLISVSDEAVTALPAVQRVLPPAVEELPNLENTQANIGEDTQDTQTQTASEIDAVQEVGSEPLLEADDQLATQTQPPQSPTNLVFTLRDARSVSLESLMLSSNEPLIISVSEASMISAIRKVAPIEIEEDEEVELQLSEVFPAVSLTDDVNVAISFTNGNVPQWVRVNRVSQSISINPPSGVKGLQNLRLGVADEAGNMAATSLTVVVSSRNVGAESSINDQASIDLPTINLARTAVQDLPGFLSVQALRPSQFDAGSRFVFEVPNGTFVHENSGEPLRYVATLADGSPLPSWMTFNPETQTFSGEAPDGAATQLDVVVKAIDSASQEAQVQLRIEVE